ncbi:UNKNOWN [Stylonychia lemnae]|uniref:GT44 domain-containing protein n=1 Tax=Stylonychia lemnae TaxID=5949 RepID=A0A078A2E9_STYLE|nr:UNKNOWN [Stylonychia lemnae]|eukprot:CDW75992.1 UNKNOWN [Stylonychia lemnae]
MALCIYCSSNIYQKSRQTRILCKAAQNNLGLERNQRDESLAIEEYFDSHNLDEEFYDDIKWETQTYAIQDAQLKAQKIPNITHHIWLTDPNNPVDIDSHPHNQEMIETTLENMAHLKFQHLLWINIENGLEKTKKWAADKKLQVRYFKSIMTKKNQEVFQVIDDYIAKGQVIFAADLFRYLVVFEMGGVYLDVDQVVFEYDLILHKLDLVLYSQQYSGIQSVETSFMASKPQNPLFKEVMKQIVKLNKDDNGQIFKSKCYQQSYYRIMYETGPFRFSVAFNKVLKEGLIDDQNYIILHYRIATQGSCPSYQQYFEQCMKELKLVLIQGYPILINVTMKHLSFGSWHNIKQELSLLRQS